MFEVLIVHSRIATSTPRYILVENVGLLPFHETLRAQLETAIPGHVLQDAQSSHHSQIRGRLQEVTDDLSEGREVPDGAVQGP